ncbi:hypothetical protein CDAR_480571 [Caerostris darwini]|uniref:Secreted protein n=1 Tax=Caerostris darwini TaxID=1538125 RepID=A0AAV4UI98_9ARAC|nr:hypothetical protein CDAR_480571 [Caerostris darwini]
MPAYSKGIVYVFYLLFGQVSFCLPCCCSCIVFAPLLKIFQVRSSRLPPCQTINIIKAQERNRQHKEQLPFSTLLFHALYIFSSSEVFPGQQPAAATMLYHQQCSRKKSPPQRTIFFFYFAVVSCTAFISSSDVFP